MKAPTSSAGKTSTTSSRAAIDSSEPVANVIESVVIKND